MHLLTALKARTRYSMYSPKRSGQEKKGGPMVRAQKLETFVKTHERKLQAKIEAAAGMQNIDPETYHVTLKRPFKTHANQYGMDYILTD